MQKRLRGVKEQKKREENNENNNFIFECMTLFIIYEITFTFYEKYIG